MSKDKSTQVKKPAKKKVAVVDFNLKSAMTEKMAVRAILMKMTDVLTTTKKKIRLHTIIQY